MEEVEEFVAWQLAEWPEAKARYDALREVKRRRVDLDGWSVGVQYNPARAVSTAAPIDKASIAARPCFLCAANRPKEQFAAPALEGWEILVNPFPIFPIHLTIASTSHRPQDRVPAEIASFAEALPGMTVFFNGARAGASAPDHLHLQAVLTEELPLMRLASEVHPFGSVSDLGSPMWARQAAPLPGAVSPEGMTPLRWVEGKAPFGFWSAVVTPDAEGMRTLARVLELTGRDPETGLADPGLVNAYFWVEKPGGLLRAVVVPRRRHRPEGYPEPLVSPGAVDMAGVVITPREEDFLGLDAEGIRGIYREVGE